LRWIELYTEGDECGIPTFLNLFLYTKLLLTSKDHEEPSEGEGYSQPRRQTTSQAGEDSMNNGYSKELLTSGSINIQTTIPGMSTSVPSASNATRHMCAVARRSGLGKGG